MIEPFSFIHASDFHLDRPPRGLAEVPDHLRETLVEAPYRAAERVFDAAVKERVDFLLLAGDLVDPLSSGPRGVLFLAEQFKRLAERSIKVYWATGRDDDAARAAAAAPLLTGAVVFPTGRVTRVVHERTTGGGTAQGLAQILGASAPGRRKIRPSDFQPVGGPFAIAVAYGTVDADSLAPAGVNFWALGGQHDRRTLASGPLAAQYSGSPQGRRPSESGPHGCTLVTVDENAFVRSTFIATDAVRFLTEPVVVEPSTSGGQLFEVINHRVAELSSDPFGPDLLVHWIVSGSRELTRALGREQLAAELAARLRSEHGSRRPAVWTVAIEPEPAPFNPALVDEETVLGEFLRTLGHYVDHSEAPLSLEPFLARAPSGWRPGRCRRARRAGRSPPCAGRGGPTGHRTLGSAGGRAMKIDSLRVDGFGVWSGLSIDDLSEELNVFYGPNEAGKTTLMQFVRSVLYGFSAERRGRYLPPVRPGRPGGALRIAADDGRYEVARHADDPLDAAIVTDQHHVVHGDRALPTLMGHVDEPTFNHVFAVGLREIQELGTLGDTQAAEELYGLALGLDRVSLADVLSDLEASRNRLLAPDERPSLITQLVSQRQRLTAEIHELGQSTARYASLNSARQQLEADVAELEATTAAHEVRRA